MVVFCAGFIDLNHVQCVLHFPPPHSLKGTITIIYMTWSGLIHWKFWRIRSFALNLWCQLSNNPPDALFCWFSEVKFAHCFEPRVRALLN
jgi:hypothetical protein